MRHVLYVIYLLFERGGLLCSPLCDPFILLWPAL